MRSQMFMTSPMSWSIKSVVVPASAMPPEPSTEILALARVEAGRRLVEAEEPWPHRDRARHTDQLALALRELRGHRVGQRVKVDQLERLERGVRHRRAPSDELARQRQERGPVRRDGEVLSHGEVVEQLGALPGPCQAAPRPDVRWHPREVAPVQLDPPGVPDEAGDRVDERRLARAVRADEADQLALGDLEIDVLDGVDSSEPHRQARRAQDGAHGGVASALRRARACAVR